LLSTRKLAGKLVFLSGQLHEAHRLLDTRRDVGRGHAAHAQAEADVLHDAHVRKERVVLEHHAKAASLGRQRVDPLVVEADRSAGERQQARDAIERGRLAAAGRTEQCDELATTDRHRQLGQRVEDVASAAGKATRHLLEPQLLEIVPHPMEASKRRTDRSPQNGALTVGIDDPTRRVIPSRQAPHSAANAIT
jgi:hypothetical protein